MLRAWKLFWICLWSILFGAVFTRNIVKYKDQPVWWNLCKSLLDITVIVLSVLFLPPFLVGTSVAWIVRDIKKTWLKVITGIISGITLGIVSAYAMEAIILLSVFSVDKITGPRKGIIGRWRTVSRIEERQLKRAA
jgi:hypothetical protein